MKINELQVQNAHRFIQILISEITDQNIRHELIQLADQDQIIYTADKEIVLTLTAAQLLDLLQNKHLKALDDELVKSFSTIYQRHQVLLKGANFKLDLTTEPAVMAILNTSPDSFFDGDPTLNDRKLMERVESMMANNTKIIDLGGQSTRPGYTEITPEVEIERTVPYIKKIKQEFPHAIISVDTYKPTVMKAVLDAGADIINDINGFEDDESKLDLIAPYHPALIAMYNNRISKWHANELRSFFINRQQVFNQHGISDQEWVVDPGVGFLSRENQAHFNDVDLIQQTSQLANLSVPMLIAISRKSMFKKQFGIDASQNVWSTLVTELMMTEMGGQIIRVHDYKETNLMLQIKRTLAAPREH